MSTPIEDANVRDAAHDDDRSPSPAASPAPAEDDDEAPVAAAAAAAEPARPEYVPRSPVFEHDTEPEAKRQRGEEAIRHYHPARPELRTDAPRVLLLPTSASYSWTLPGEPRTTVSVLLLESGECERLTLEMCRA
jgi:hypothetical protein